jgi:hypothetical protein
MIALVRVSPPLGREGLVEQLSALPPPPCTRFHGFFVRCDGTLSIGQVLSWFEGVRKERHGVPIALVCDPSPDEMQALAGAEFPISPLLRPVEVLKNVLPDCAFQGLSSRTVATQIQEVWMAGLGSLAQEDRELLSHIVLHGIQGGTLASLSRKLGISSKTLCRKVRRVTPCGGKCLMRRARVDFIQIQLGQAGNRRAVLASAGFVSQRAFEKTIRRDKIRRLDGSGCTIGSGDFSGPCPFSVMGHG